MNSTFLFHLSWKTLWRKKARTFLTIFTIGISVLTFLFFLGLQRGYSKAIVRDIDTFGAHLLALPKGCPYEATAVILQGGILPKQLSDDVFLTIQKNPYVKYSYAMLIGVLPSQYDTGRLDRLVGVTQDAREVKNGWQDISESDFNRFLSGEAVIIGHNIAKEYSVEAGETFTIGSNSEEFFIASVLSETNTEDDISIFVQLHKAQEWFKQEGKISGVAVTVANIESINEAVQSIEDIQDVQVITMTDIVFMILEYLDILQWLIIGILCIALFASGIQIFNTITINVWEQTKQIAVLKAFGASKGQIATWIFIQAFYISVVGYTVGFVLILFLMPLLEVVVKSVIVSAPSGNIVSLIPFHFFLVLSVIVILAFFACIYPIVYIGKEKPAIVLASKNL